MFFELEDIKRRHSPTWNLYNTTSWHTAVDSYPSWNYKRGVIVGLLSSSFQQYVTHFINHGKLMLKHYEPPTNLKQAWIFFRQIRKLESFTSGFKSRMQMAVSGAFFDIGIKIALFRQFNSGWSCNFAGVDYNLYRKIPTTALAFILASPFGVAVEMLQRAYIANKTFPQKLQKGYKNFFDAVKRIPFQQGPYYLFKNTFPLYAKHIIGPFTAFYLYDYFRDKFSLFWRITNNPMLPIKIFVATLAAYTATVFSYPFAHTVREMVDFWPKKNGVDPFEGNYRRAAAWLWFGPSWNIGFPGLFKIYFWHTFPLWFSTLLLADHLGIFSYWKINMISGSGDNTSEDSFI